MVVSGTKAQDPEGKFIAMLLDGIRNKRITLPTLPEVAIKVRNAAASPPTCLSLGSTKSLMAVYNVWLLRLG